MDESVCVFGKILSKEDFDEICRCCLSQGPLASLFEVFCEGTPLADIFYGLFGTQLDSNDDLPKKLCETCIGEVIRCYNFKKRYEATEAALRSIIATKTEDVEFEIKPEPLRGSLKELGETQVNEKIIVEACHSIEYECGERFNSNDTLESHSLVESSEKTFVCGVCDKKFARKVSLQMHHSVHTGETPFDCPVCSKKFSQKATLTRHLKSHTGERPYICKYCDKSYLQRHTLNIHIRSHTGEKPYKCDMCTDIFCDLRALKNHKKRKHQQI